MYLKVIVFQSNQNYPGAYSLLLFFSCEGISDYLQLHGLQHTRLPCPISQSLLRLMSIESVMLSNYLILCLPLFLLPSIFSSIRVFSKESPLGIRWPKYWSFSPSNEYSGLISFRSNWFELLAAQRTLKSLLQPQFKSINSLALILLYGPTLPSMHDYWKNLTFIYTDLCWQNDVSAF